MEYPKSVISAIVPLQKELNWLYNLRCDAYLLGGRPAIVLHLMRDFND